MESAEPARRERRIVWNLVVSTEPAEPAPFPDMAGIPDKCHRQQQARIMLTSAHQPEINFGPASSAVQRLASGANPSEPTS